LRVLGQKACRNLCAEVVRLLHEERQRRKISKYTIGERSGLSQQMVGYVERGMRNPSFETIMRMADALEVDLEKIIARARREVSVKTK
jgi:transcriptional regulator with XRE-family HTH domain